MRRPLPSIRRLIVAALLVVAVPLSAQTPDGPVVMLRLSDGTVLVGRVVEDTDTRIRIATENLGEISIAPSLVVERGSPAEARPPAAQAVQAPPPPPVQTTSRVSWTRTATASASYASAPFIQKVIDPAIPALTGAALGLPGRQVTVNANAVVQRVTPTDAFQLTGATSYLNAQPTGALTNGFEVDGEYRRSISPRVYWLTRTTDRQDKVRNVQNAFLETVAAGFVVHQTARTRFDLLPGVVLHREVKKTQYDDDWLVSAGAMAALVAQLSKTASLQARITGRKNLQHSEIYSFESYTGVTGALTPRVGLTVGLTYNYDNLLGQAFEDIPAGRFFPGSPALRVFPTNKYQAQLTSGLQVSF